MYNLRSVRSTSVKLRVFCCFLNIQTFVSCSYFLAPFSITLHYMIFCSVCVELNGQLASPRDCFLPLRGPRRIIHKKHGPSVIWHLSVVLGFISIYEL